MHLTCIICSDIIAPSSETYSTQCGHLFHFPCLLQWMDQSKTCPQCRDKTTSKSIHRVYLNFANVNGEEDLGVLQSKLENAQFQLRLKEKDNKIFDEKYTKIKSQNISLRKEVAELETKVGGHNSVVLGLKDQISFLKAKSKAKEQLDEEVAFLKMKLKQMESINNILYCNREEVTQILRNEQNNESLALMVATLKRTLLDVEKRKKLLEQKLKRSQNDLVKCKHALTALEQQLSDVRNNSSRRLSVKPNSENVSICCTEKREIIKANETEVPSPSLDERVVAIVNSESPYLAIKVTSTNPTKSLKNHVVSLHGCTVSKQVSIFNNAVANPVMKKISSNSLVYNGLGGQSKEDIFPSPKSAINGGKRPRTDSYKASTKFKRVAPLAFKKK